MLDLLSVVPLHSTMFLLILFCLFSLLCQLQTLHSTMFLLIQKAAKQIVKNLQSFTFHYVSINTKNIKSTTH